jgi:hypothetical protein
MSRRTSRKETSVPSIAKPEWIDEAWWRRHGKHMQPMPLRIRDYSAALFVHEATLHITIAWLDFTCELRIARNWKFPPDASWVCDQSPVDVDRVPQFIPECLYRRGNWLCQFPRLVFPTSKPLTADEVS